MCYTVSLIKITVSLMLTEQNCQNKLQLPT